MPSENMPRILWIMEELWLQSYDWSDKKKGKKGGLPSDAFYGVTTIDPVSLSEVPTVLVLARVV